MVSELTLQCTRIFVLVFAANDRAKRAGDASARAE